MLSKHVLATI